MESPCHEMRCREHHLGMYKCPCAPEGCGQLSSHPGVLQHRSCPGELPELRHSATRPFVDNLMTHGKQESTLNSEETAALL